VEEEGVGLLAAASADGESLGASSEWTSLLRNIFFLTKFFSIAMKITGEFCSPPPLEIKTRLFS
jgi:hypothetical protein